MFGRRIKEYRTKKSLKLVELARIIGISHGTLSDIENEKTNPSAKTLALIVRSTDINPHYLITGVGEMIKPPTGSIFERIKISLNIKSDAKLEKELGVRAGSVSYSKMSGELPYAYIVSFCVRRGLSVDWVMTGEGEKFKTKPLSINLNFLKEIIESVEKVFEEGKLHLPPQKKAELITLLYDELLEEPAKDSLLKDKIIKFARLIV